MHNIVIMQINNDIAKDKLFLNYDMIGRKVNMSDYKVMWCGVRASSNPEDIYTEFNLERPQDFYGHSLSVSDIVMIDNAMYFCDSVGFVRL